MLVELRFVTFFRLFFSINMKCPISASKTSPLKVVIMLAVTVWCVASSQASIVYLSANATGLVINFSYDSTNSTIQIGGSTGTYGSLSTEWFGFWINSLGQGGSSPVGYSATDPSPLASLAFDTPINASSSWTDPLNPACDLVDAYFGIRIDQGGSNYNYGWVQISTPSQGDPAGYLTLTSIAFESTLNTEILAGAMPVPEPSTVALLGLAGGVALLQYLRRKKTLR